MTKLLLILGIILSLSHFSFSKNRSPSVYDLRCENLRNPLGVDTFKPRFSWKISCNKNGTEQKACQLMAATDSTLLNSDKADLWDSGIFNSSASILVPYCGKQLSSVELKDGNVEQYAGIPQVKDAQVIRKWRAIVSIDKFKEIRKIFNDKGVTINILKLSD